jgi:hypothetical protein
MPLPRMVDHCHSLQMEHRRIELLLDICARDGRKILEEPYPELVGYPRLPVRVGMPWWHLRRHLRQQERLNSYLRSKKVSANFY